MHHWTRRRFLAMAAVACAATPLLRGEAPATRPSAGLVQYGPTRQFRITHTIELRLNDIRPRSIELWLPVPQNGPEQEIREVKIEPKVPVVRDPFGQAAVAKLYQTSGFTATQEVRRLTVSYHVTRRAIALDRSAAMRFPYGPYRKDRWYDYYTRAEAKVESRLPAIIELAGQLQQQAKSPLDFARRAYDWVLDHTEYKIVNNILGARYCLENGHGECGDYSALFVAICRAGGIPARTITGCWGDGVDKWHCWAEFMLPTGDWVPVDGSIGDQNRLNRQFYFGSMDNGRVAFCKTYQLTLPNVVAGQREIEFLQAGAFWWYANEIPEGARRPEATFTVTGQPAEG